MSVEVRVPVLPESVADATLVSWHKKPGDAVKQDENLVDVETDKVVLELPAPQDGVLKEIIKGDGETVTAQEVIAVIEAGAAAAASAPTAAPKAQQSAPQVPAQQANTEDLSPAVKRMVSEHQLDVSQIPATGRGGRVTKEDVINYVKAGPATTKPAAAQSAGKAPTQEKVLEFPGMPTGDRAERRVKMTRIRARIAERLLEAQANAAILTTFNEIDLTTLIDVRTRYKEQFEKTHGVKLGFMSFFVKACIEGLKRFPQVNASIDGTDVVYHDYYDIGIAVGSARGLVVPILRDAEILSFAETEAKIAEFGAKAKEGNFAMDELTGGTFTVTNGGVFGSLLSTPILNPPQSGILGMHKIQERPMVVNGKIEVRKMMYVALSYDHRIIDGREAVQFLVTVKDALEDPTRLLLQV